MPLITTAKIQALQTIVKREFENGLKDTDATWKKVAMEVSSANKSNTYTWLGDFPQLREWVGDREYKSMKAQSYEIQNKLWESTVGIDRQDVEDDNLGHVPLISRSRGEAVVESYNQIVYGLLKDGENIVGYDGQNFFDTEHPVNESHDGSSQTNSLVSNFTDGAEAPWYLLCTKRTIKPFLLQIRVKPDLDEQTNTTNDTVFNKDQFAFGIRARHSAGVGLWQMAHKSKAALTEANFNAAYKAMSEVKADGGRPLNFKPDLLVVPPSLRATAHKLVKAQFEAGMASNPNYEIVDVLETPYVMV